MNFFTHIMFSEALYRQLSRKMDLDRKAFFYGNIKPDLSSKCLRNPHLLENYLFIVADSSNRLIEENPPQKEFSVDLGVICHYICDFFCYSHLNHKIYHMLFSHFKYEVRLHLAYCSMRMNKNTGFTKSKRIRSGGIASMIIEMRKEYMTKQKSFQRDIIYALDAAQRACELINDLRASYTPCRVSSEYTCSLLPRPRASS